MTDLLSASQPEILEFFAELNQPAYRARQVFEWLHKKHVSDFSHMSNLSKGFRALLAERCYISDAKVVQMLESADDGTVKYLLSLGDETLLTPRQSFSSQNFATPLGKGVTPPSLANNLIGGVIIESVLMKYSHGNSVCVSTQAGCKMGCTFCASGEDFVRNLTAGEICAQVYTLLKDCERIDNIVLMGCGEPLDNFEAVVQFIEIITHPDGLNIGGRHITLSTCGLVPEILQLAKMKMQITLAVSLHAPTDDVRRTFMPIAKRYSVRELIEACRQYFAVTGRRITFEYALAKGVNDSPAQAKELARLLRDLNCHVNLIPINKARGDFLPTSRKDVAAFAAVLQECRIQTTVRRSLGGDIGGACGQLRGRGRNIM